MGSWLGSLSTDDWRRQRERQKAIGLDWQNEHLCTCTLFFLYISLPSLHDYDVKIPNFTFSGGREHKTTTSFFFSWTIIHLLQGSLDFFSSLVLHLCIFFLVDMYLSLFLSFSSFLFFFCLLFFLLRYSLSRKQSS